MTTCPFCGASETDRFDLEGRRFLVFGCMFTPVIPPDLPEDRLGEYLARTYGAEGAAYFRRTCDRLHLHVTRPATGVAAPARPVPEA